MNNIEINKIFDRNFIKYNEFELKTQIFGITFLP